MDTVSLEYFRGSFWMRGILSNFVLSFLLLKPSLHVACGVGASTKTIQNILKCYPEATLMKTTKGSSAKQCLNLTNAANKDQVKKLIRKYFSLVEEKYRPFKEPQQHPTSIRELVWFVCIIYCNYFYCLHHFWIGLVTCRFYRKGCTIDLYQIILYFNVRGSVKPCSHCGFYSVSARSTSFLSVSVMQPIFLSGLLNRRKSHFCRALHSRGGWVCTNCPKD